MFSGMYEGRRVLITGATGYKGSWMAYWLVKLGAKVMNISRHPPTTPCHFEVLGLDRLLVDDIRADLRYGRDIREIKQIFDDFKPEIVYHLAAMAIVAKTFGDPQGTFEGNIMSALNILDICRFCKSVKAIVIITTDKVYEEKPFDRGYHEHDVLGGLDPYSASKVCVEHIAECYRTQYFPMISVARAGNVIGGGDWAYKRLIPDIVRAAIRGEKTEIHTPYAVRPWQFVLEPLTGYLMLGERLLMGEEKFAGPWNFGPEGSLTVLQVMEIAKECWPKIQYKIDPQEHHPSMVRLLTIDSTKAKNELGWFPVWNVEQAVQNTINWYREYYGHNVVSTNSDISRYCTDRERHVGIRDDAP
jgi:CDP-glucose 4,6-dehydratase